MTEERDGGKRRRGKESNEEGIEESQGRRGEGGGRYSHTFSVCGPHSHGGRQMRRERDCAYVCVCVCACGHPHPLQRSNRGQSRDSFGNVGIFATVGTALTPILQSDI